MYDALMEDVSLTGGGVCERRLVPEAIFPSIADCRPLIAGRATDDLLVTTETISPLVCLEDADPLRQPLATGLQVGELDMVSRNVTERIPRTLGRVPGGQVSLLTRVSTRHSGQVERPTKDCHDNPMRP